MIIPSQPKLWAIKTVAKLVNSKRSPARKRRPREIIPSQPELWAIKTVAKLVNPKRSPARKRKR